MIEFTRIHVLVNSYDQDLPWDVLFYTLHVLVLPTAVIMAVLSGVNLAKDVNRSIRIKKSTACAGCCSLPAQTTDSFVGSRGVGSSSQIRFEQKSNFVLIQARHVGIKKAFAQWHLWNISHVTESQCSSQCL